MQPAETECYVALGGNVGPVAKTFQQALELLQGAPEVCVGRSSGLYQTSPVGPRRQKPLGSRGTYLNAVVQLWTTQLPESLLHRLLDIEARLGRSRSGPWQPRPIDLDLILYGSQVIRTEELIVPHPACWYRRFVLDPLSEIAADLVHPVKRRTIADLRERLLRRPFRCALVSADHGQARRVAEQLAPEFPDVQFPLLAEEDPTRVDAELVVCWTKEPPVDLHAPDRAHPDALFAPTELDAAIEFVRTVLQSALGQCVRVS